MTALEAANLLHQNIDYIKKAYQLGLLKCSEPFDITRDDLITETDLKAFMTKDYIFDEKEHIYRDVITNEIIPNVSTILTETIFREKYAGVSNSVLKNAADFGKRVHAAIEYDNPFMLESDLEHKKYNEWLEIQKEKFIITQEKEQVVRNYKHNYIGTFDMVALVMGVKSLGDVKTTYELDIEYISWQLSLYYWAKRDFSIKGLFAIWLPKRRKGGIVSIPLKSEEEIESLIMKYKEKENETK